MSENNINHMAFVVDASSSMSGLSDATIKVFDNQIAHLARRSKEMEQETRVSVYFFASDVTCIIFDKDVLRLPSLRGLYHAGGNTALIDGAVKSIEDLETTSQIYGDHSFLIFVLTDGEENNSNSDAEDLSKKLKSLPDNWTLAVLVPNSTGVFEAKKAGFPANNIDIWDPSAKGIIEAGEKLKRVTESYMEGRKAGVRGTKSLFRVDISSLSSKKVNDNLDSLKGHEFQAVDLKKDGTIRDVVEKATKKDYVKGSSFYQLTKPEMVQSYKKIAIRNKVSGFVYVGDKARSFLGLPDSDAKIRPEDLGKFDVFVQSTSVNRRLIAGTTLLIIHNP
jgi:von Willebrand factor type A domain-containing protein